MATIILQKGNEVIGRFDTKEYSANFENGCIVLRTAKAQPTETGPIAFPVRSVFGPGTFDHMYIEENE